MSIEEDFLNYKSEPLENPIVTEAIEKTEQTRQALIRKDIGGAVTNWAKGAVQGAEEVGRAATQVALTAPERITDLGIDTSEPTTKDADALTWYQKASETFQEETVKPISAAAALTGNAYGFMAFLPFLSRQLSKDIEQKGTSQALKDTALESIPIYGSVKTAQEEAFQQYASQYPLRAAGLLLMNEAPNVFPLRTILSKGNTGLHNAQEMLKKELKKTSKKETTAVTKEEALPKVEAVEKPKLSTKLATELKIDKDNAFYNGIEDDLISYKKEPISNRNKKNRKERKITKKRAIKMIAEELVAKAETQKENKAFLKKVTEASVPFASSTLKNNVSLNDIWNMANSITTVRSGRLHKVKDTVQGYFNKDVGDIRTRNLTDFNTLAHEVGHAIDKQLQIKGADKELTDAATLKWGKTYLKKDRRDEGVAEFMTQYLYNDKEAAKNFPEYSLLFKEALKKKPELAEKVEALGQMIRKFKADMTPEAKVRGTTKFHTDKDNTFDLKTALNNLTTRLYTDFVDKTFEANKFLEDTLGSIADSANPLKKAQDIVGQIPGRVSLLTGQADVSTKAAIAYLEKVYNVELNEVTLKDVFTNLKTYSHSRDLKNYLEQTKVANMYEAFSGYITAKRFVEIIDIANQKHLAEIQAKLDKAKTALQYAKTLETKEKWNKQVKEYEETLAQIREGKKDIATPLSKKEYQEVIDNAPYAFKESEELLRLYNENLLELAEKGGFISEKDKQILLETQPNYIPLRRDFSIEQGLQEELNVGNATTYANISSYFKKLNWKEGSDRTVLEPLVELEKASYRLINNIEKNEVAQKVYALSQYTNVGHKIASVVSGDTSDASKHIITVWDKGKKIALQITSPELYNFLAEHQTATNKTTLKYLEVLRKQASLLRATATSTPFYMLFNFIKDSQFSAIASKNNMKPWSALEGFALRKDEELLAAFIGEGVHHSTIQTADRIASERLQAYTLGKDSSFWSKDKIAGRLLKSYKNWLNAAEEAPRLVEFKRTLDNYNNLTKAGQFSKDITVNFARSGRIGVSLNKYIPFFNAAVQGTDKAIRAFKENPQQVVLRGVEFITLPTVALWLQNKDKEWYRNLNYDDKMKYWFWEMPFSDGQVILKIPKPELFGYAFGSVPERLLDSVKGDTQSFEGLGEFLAENTIPNYVPTSLLLIGELSMNYDTFRNKNIVPSRDKDKVEKAEQYNIYTSELAKGLGKATNTSPLLIDHAIKGQTSEVGTIFLNITDMLLKDNQTPTKKWTERTRLTHSLRKGSRTAEVFYDGLNKLERKSNSHKITPKERANLQGLRSIKTIIDNYRSSIKDTLNNEKLDGDKKRAIVDKYESKIKQTQILANKKYLNYTYIN